MNCLVTGGAGFIGSHITDLLVERGHSVLVIDDLSRGKQAHVNPQARFIELDLRDPELPKVLLEQRTDYVFHTAAQVSVQTSLRQPLHDASVNIVGTLNLLEACRLAGVRKIIYSSTAAVYGEPRYLPMDEEHPLNPCSAYGVSKMVPEKYLPIYRELYGLDYTVLRYANVYGPRQDAAGEGGVAVIFCRQLLQGETPVIFGDGEQTRDFVYVCDAAAANLAAMEKGAGQIYNISTGKAISIKTLLQAVADIVGKETRPQYLPAKAGDILHSCLSSTKAAQDLGWQPTTSLREGLLMTLHSLSAK